MSSFKDILLVLTLLWLPSLKSFANPFIDEDKITPTSSYTIGPDQYINEFYPDVRKLINNLSKEDISYLVEEKPELRVVQRYEEVRKIPLCESCEFEIKQNIQNSAQLKKLVWYSLYISNNVEQARTLLKNNCKKFEDCKNLLKRELEVAGFKKFDEKSCVSLNCREHFTNDRAIFLKSLGKNSLPELYPLIVESNDFRILGILWEEASKLSRSELKRLPLELGNIVKAMYFAQKSESKKAERILSKIHNPNYSRLIRLTRLMEVFSYEPFDEPVFSYEDSLIIANSFSSPHKENILIHLNHFFKKKNSADLMTTEQLWKSTRSLLNDEEEKILSKNDSLIKSDPVPVNTIDPDELKRSTIYAEKLFKSGYPLLYKDEILRHQLLEHYYWNSRVISVLRQLDPLVKFLSDPSKNPSEDVLIPKEVETEIKDRFMDQLEHVISINNNKLRLSVF